MAKKPKSKTRKIFDRIVNCLIIIAVLFGLYMLGFRLHRSFRQIVPQKVYSSRQPSPQELQKWIDEYGIKTIINLRGFSPDSTPEEVAIAEANGVKLITYSWSAHNTPRHPFLKRFIADLETIQTPLLIHCKSGIDRSGTAAAMAAMEIGKEDYYKAKRHAFVPPGPWKRKKRKEYVHVSDVFTEFEKYCKQNNTTPTWPLMKEWANTTWQSYYSFYNVEYTLPEQITIPAGSDYTISVNITNHADRDIPAETNNFNLFAYMGDCISKGSDFKVLGPYTPLPKQNIQPNQTITIEQKITAPAEPGRYKLNFNIDTEFDYNFETHGSAIGTAELIVTSPDTQP